MLEELYIQRDGQYAMMVFGNGNTEQKNNATIEYAVQPVEDE